jgi:DNA-binding transcriptional regulator LsrR (DeoR family)
MAKVARLYYEHGLRQQEITARLGIHQSTISRLLKRARDTNMVRISIAPPSGVHAELEDAIEQKFGLQQAIIVDIPDDAHADDIDRALGTAAAFYLETTIRKDMVIGLSPWGRAQQAMVDRMSPNERGKGGTVVQILGGTGNVQSRHYGSNVIEHLARNIGGTPVLLQAPAVVGSTEARRILSSDPTVQEASAYFDKIDLAVVALGSLEPARSGFSSGGVTFTDDERAELSKLGAVGDVCLRFIDSEGKPIRSALINRVMGIELNSLKTIGRVVGIAGGPRKFPVIRAAIKAGLVHILITDQHTAERLLADVPVAAKREKERQTAG